MLARVQFLIVGSQGTQDLVIALLKQQIAQSLAKEMMARQRLITFALAQNQQQLWLARLQKFKLA